MDLLSEGTIEYLPKKKRDRILYYAGFVLLLIFYVIAYKNITVAARSDNTILFFGNDVPFSIFTGVFSSIANICIFFLVVFYGRLGFTTSLALLLLQFSGLLMSFAQAHTTAAIPGVFSNVLTLIAIVLMYHSNKTVKRYQIKEFEHLKQQQMFSQKLFEQTATALVNAIDAKDTYSHGHSLRVAEYSERIARKMGKSDEECYKIFYSALLHDVGKIGIDDSIINKKGALEPYEYNMIKQHPVIGNEILSSITEYPYLSVGAHYHHERYDGKGYPDRLKGDDIPEIARIISVADAYDAMSSNRSYRDAIPQQLIREEIVKGAGVQFDPGMAKIMLHL
ncbi:MAG: HD-GYP domain-containing protein, partial [Lachnospiraceae bacterium]|nr:HD-GYP domain-containing protein [Lachnospiraceae bacterium]